VEKDTQLSSILSPDKRALFARLLAREGLAGGADTIRPRARDLDAIPLSFAQQRLWVTDRLTPGATAYNVAAVLRLHGVLSVDALERAFTALIERHESLRTVFALRGDAPIQSIKPPYPIAIAVRDLQAPDTSAQQSAVAQMAADDAQRPFNLSTDALLRVSLLRLARDEHRLVVTMHHIISDGWSIGILIRELTALYMRAVQNEPVQLPALALQYADFALWQREQLQPRAIERPVSFWREQLAGVPTLLPLPTDRPRPQTPSFRGALHRFSFERSLLDRLRDFGRQQNSTLFMTLLAAFHTLLHRYTGQTDLLVGTPLANRNRPELEGIIGFFVNVLLMRGDFRSDPTFRDLLDRTRDTCLAAYAHQDVPFEVLVETLAPQRHAGCTPFFQVMFVLQNAPAAKIQLPDLDVSIEDGDTASAPFDLTVSVQECDEGLAGSFEYSTDLFDAATIAKMADHFHTLLNDIVDHPDRRVSTLSLITADESRVIQILSRGQRRDVRAASVADLVDARAARTPDAVAVIAQQASGTTQATYSDIARQSDQLARALNELGVEGETCVGICLTSSILWCAALVGVLKAGGACVLLDPNWPKERLRQVLAAANVKLALTDSSLAHVLSALPVHAIELDTAMRSSESRNVRRPAREICGEQLAFVVSTSGSTGTPKCVMVPHRSVVSYCTAIAEAYALGPDDRVLQFSSPAFDVAVEELFPTWLSGASVVLRPWAHAPTPADFVQLVESARVSVVNVSSSYWHTWVEALPSEASVPHCVRLVIAGSERTSAKHLRRWTDQTASEWRNAYGTTETTVTTTVFRPDRERVHSSGVVPVGQPISNTEVFVLDANLAPAPLCVPGDVYVGGLGVSRGYLGDPHKTAEHFVPHPFASEVGARLYRTGDRGRWRADGALEILDRTDRQVKLHGVRVELGDIEAALENHPAVSQCAVVKAGDGPGDERLIAHLVLSSAAPLPPTELRSFLLERLPRTMLPTACVLVDALPLNSAGKVDYRALASDAGQVARPPFVPPRTAAEQRLAAIWADALRLERVGIHDNFFDLGGHSLLATQIVSRVARAFDIELSVGDIFEYPTVADLAARVAPLTASRRGAQYRTIARVPRTGKIPLAVDQELPWAIQKAMPRMPLFNMPFSIWLTGALDIAALEWALNEILRRHEVLRTTFIEIDGEAAQVISPETTLRIALVDLAGMDPSEIHAEVARRVAAEAYQAIDLTRAPLLRAAVLQLAGANYIVLLTLPHIVGDLWSIDVLRREIEVLYSARVAGQPSPLPALRIQYADYAVWRREWLRGAAAADQLRYWRRKLAPPLPAQQLPLDFERPQELALDTARISFMLPGWLADETRRASAECDCTVFTTVLTAFKIALSEQTGEPDVRVATLTANRAHVEVEDLIGLFANTLILRTNLSGAATFDSCLQRVRQTIVEAYAHQDLPFEILIDELKSDYGPHVGGALSTVLVQWQDADDLPVRLPNLTARGLIDGNPVSDAGVTLTIFDLIITFGAGPSGLFSQVKYKTGLFERETVERLFGRFQRVLEEGVAIRDRRRNAVNASV
jgi:amino acid adenylation domain-containing protein